jgi:hypothetical protein
MSFDPITFGKVGSVSKQIKDNRNLIDNLIAMNKPLHMQKQIDGSNFESSSGSGKASGTKAIFADVESAMTIKLAEINNGAGAIYQIHYDNVLGCYFAATQSGLQKYDLNGTLIGSISPAYTNGFVFTTNNRGNFTWDANNVYLADRNGTTDAIVKAYRKSDLVLLWQTTIAHRVDFLTTQDNLDKVFLRGNGFTYKGLNKTDGVQSWASGDTYDPYASWFDFRATKNGYLMITDRYGYDSTTYGHYGVRVRVWDIAINGSTLTQYVTSNTAKVGRHMIEDDGVYLYWVTGTMLRVFDIFNQSIKQTIYESSIDSAMGISTNEAYTISSSSDNQNIVSVWRNTSVTPITYFAITHKKSSDGFSLLYDIKPAIELVSEEKTYSTLFEMAQGDFIALSKYLDGTNQSGVIYKEASPPILAHFKYNHAVSTSAPATLKMWAFAELLTTINANNQLWVTLDGLDKNTNANGEPNFEDITSQDYRFIVNDRVYEETAGSATDKIKVKNALQANILWANKVEVNGSIISSDSWTLSTNDNRTITFKNTLNMGDVVEIYYDMNFIQSSLPFFVHISRIDSSDLAPSIDSVVLAYEI